MDSPSLGTPLSPMLHILHRLTSLRSQICYPDSPLHSQMLVLILALTFPHARVRSKSDSIRPERKLRWLSLPFSFSKLHQIPCPSSTPSPVLCILPFNKYTEVAHLCLHSGTHLTLLFAEPLSGLLSLTSTLS